MSEQQEATPLSNCDLIKGKIGELAKSLRESLPNYESLLHTIHVALHKDEECTILLSPEEVGVLCAGLSKKKNITIVESTTKSTGKKTAGGKKLSDVTLDDLGG